MTCTHCGADTDGITLCHQCNQTLTIGLVNVASFFADVERIRPGQRVKVRGAHQSTPPPAVEPPRDKISGTLDHVATIVFGWCRNLEDDRPQVKAMPATTELRCGWLENYLPSIHTLEWAGELLREIRECERDLQRILDHSDTGWYAGVCGNEIGRQEVDGEAEPVLCSRELYGTQSSVWVRCGSCGRTWDAEQRHESMRREAENELAPIRVIARVVVGLMDEETSVERLTRRIEQWVQRGRLRDYGVRVLDGKPRRVYRIGDVLALVTGDREKVSA